MIRIRIMLIDDHIVVRSGLKALLDGPAGRWTRFHEVP